MEQILKTAIIVCTILLIATLFSFTGFSISSGDIPRDESTLLLGKRLSKVKIPGKNRLFSGIYEGKGYHRYFDEQLDLQHITAGSPVRLYVRSLDVPNRFTIKRNGNTLVYSSWLGCTEDYGPWGGPFCNSGMTTLRFTKESGSGSYTLHVETLTSEETDAWEAY